MMDIMENGLDAGATLIHLRVVTNRKENVLKFSIGDNGRGIPKDLLEKVLDPFYTTRLTRRVGLGLSLFREASKRCDGEFSITSSEGKGTQIEASFRLDHIDLPPMGDLGSSLAALIMGNPGVDFAYTHEVDGKVFDLDTREIKEELEGVPINHPEVVKYIATLIRESLEDGSTESDTSSSWQGNE
jgi:hypothetical protein